ncbi:MAG: DUF721 domain-containing protein [Parachlamydiaceae bacterium]
MKKLPRTPKNYDGQKLTTHKISDVLPCVLEQITEHFSDRPDLVLAAWPDVIGPQLASMTRAVSFKDGVLLVVVRNSTLYSLLNQNDKPKILTILRKKFPKIEIKTILFRIG